MIVPIQELEDHKLYGAVRLKQNSSWREFIFNLAYFAFGLGYFLVFQKKIKQAENGRELIRQRLGMLPDFSQRIAGRKVVWIHAVSVGEVMAIRKFLADFQRQRPDLYCVLTTVTPTGQKIAKEMESESLTALYFPFDFSFACKRFFQKLQPELLLLVETEIWPNLLMQAGHFQVPAMILNGRLSEKSKKRYRQFRFLFDAVLRNLDFILAQDTADARRFLELGIPSSRVAVAGNMKFDNVLLQEPDPAVVTPLKNQWGFKAGEQILVAGSTHPQEEEKVLAAFVKLKQKFPALKMLLAPRHIERSEEIAKLVSGFGLQPCLATTRSVQTVFDVLILNQLGVLKILYQMADVVYMGGSLTARGGQNPIEPASFKKPVIHGPHVFNFEKIYRDLDQKGGGYLVRNEEELARTAATLLTEDVQRTRSGQNAFALLQDYQGATQRHLQQVLSFLTARS